jgi:hypothetical protein
MKKQRTPSTKLPHAIPWADIAGEVEEPFARALGVNDAEAALADPERTAERLSKASGAELAVLEMIVEGGGRLWTWQVVNLTQQRHGWTVAKMQLALDALEHDLLAFQVHDRYQMRGGASHAVGILDIAGDAIASRVLGLSLPQSRPSAETLPAPTSPAIRTPLAVLAATAHRPVKITQRLDVNRASARKTAAMVGLPENQVTEILDLGIAARILVGDGFVARPDPEALLALARGERTLSRSAEQQLAVAWTPSDRWIPKDALVRAITHAHLDSYAVARAEKAIAPAGLATLMHEGHAFVRRTEPEVMRRGEPGAGDGHVTPSFEIMLGPRADPEIIATLGLAAEPVRMDRVITLKLTPSSVASAIACGLGYDAIAAALASVGRHAVPENVAIMVRDWAEGARIVRVRPVWSAECSTKETADAAQKALGERVIARPTPTLLLVADDPTAALNRAKVRTVGLGISQTATPFDAPHDPQLDSPAGGVPFAPPAPPILEAVADATLARRFADARTNGFPVDGRGASLSRAFEAILEGAQNDDLCDLLELVIPAAVGCELELGRWASKLGTVERTRVEQTIAERPLDFVRWIVLPQRLRSEIIQMSRTVGALLNAAERSHAPTPLSRQIDELVRTSPTLRALLGMAPPAKDQAIVPQGPDEIERRFKEAAARGTILLLRVSSKTSGERVVAVTPERVVARGEDTILLGVDATTLENRSYPLRNVISAELSSERAT